MPVFSAIVPAYNAEKYIGETIESVLKQQGATFEVIVVDDGSTDETVKIVNGFKSQVNLIQQKNAGASSARNAGAQSAKGDFLAFVDADDLWLSEKLKTQQSKINEGFNFVYTNRYNIGDKGDLPYLQTDCDSMYEGDIFERLLYNNFITNSSVVIKKELFDCMNGFNINLLTCEDWDLWLRCSAGNLIGFCPEPLVQYRFHANCKSRNYKRQALTREKIIKSVLSTGRGAQLISENKKRILAHNFSTSAWASARSNDLWFALQMYFKALSAYPYDISIWYNILRCLAGRA